MALMKLPPVSAFEAFDFSGGLNLRDAPSKLEPGDSPDSMNVTLDERGGGAKRLGLLRVNAGALAGVAKNLFYSGALAVNIIQVGATLYKTSDWVTVTSFATFTTSARAGLCDFNGKIVAVHPVDGVFDYDGTTWASRNATVKGTCIAPWQNKLWVAGDGPRVWWSNAGSSATWTTASDFNDLREKDNKACTAIGIGQGMDVAGRPGLLVFKEDSAYRINSSSTGTYTTIDARAGCSGPLALVSLFGYTIAFNKSGIYRCDGNTMELVSSKIEPIFDRAQINLTYLPDVVAGVFQDRAVFSFPFGAAQTTNNRTLEYHPLDGWIVPHNFGAAGYTIDSTGKLLSSSPTTAYVRETFRGGQDEGAAIASRFQTRWFVIEKGYRCQMQRLRIAGSGTFDMYVRTDFELGQGELYDVVLAGEAFTWNGAGINWNGAGVVWGPTVYEEYQDFHALGAASAVSFVFEETSSVIGSGPALLRDGASPEIGAFSFYSLLLDYVRLGLS